MKLMQFLSHGTRAFIVNANGMPGFVLRFDIISVLRKADDAGRLEHARKYQVIDLNTIESKLEKLDSNKEIEVEGKLVK